ncbi:replication-associated recombination protein A [Rickettsiales bacterium]|nr:replication-associated recombination protein A [Rickettsiales bacterium]
MFKKICYWSVKNLFEDNIVENDNLARPLADCVRPSSLDEIFGQDHLLAKDGSLSRLLDKGYLPSIILWGTPGCGKTTLARLLADKCGYKFDSVSAVANGAADLRKIFQKAQDYKKIGEQTLLMVDEIHRFNRAQQDLFLPYVEDGTIILVGATTENPSFELNAALLSRCKVLVLNALDVDSLKKLISRAEEFKGRELPLDEDARQILCEMADGDGRYLLGMCEELFYIKNDKLISPEELPGIIQKRFPIYDKNHDGHYNLISALHKSLRGSDPDAALYWFARMADAGEDMLYIARRLVRFAVEDIGLADPQSLVQANAAKDAYQFLGSPEGDLAISQAVVYLATAPKSNAVYKAHNEVMRDAKRYSSIMPPKHILNAPTKLMKEQGYKDGYIYDHDTPECFSGQDYFPEDMGRREYYLPVERGYEREIKKRVDYWNKLRQKKSC